MSNTNSSSENARPAPTTSAVTEDVSCIVDTISDSSFGAWLNEKEHAENILQGKSFFNGPAKRPDPERHKPSLLLRCPRLAVYRRRNAPKETRAPDGLFWAGSEIEEQIVVPFLQDVTPDSIYVQNSVWLDATIDEGVDEELILRGVTDPVLVSPDATPLVVTEVKSTTSIEHRSSPTKHHRAQLMSYLYALNQVHDHDIPGVLVYLDRETFELKSFFEAFDPEFWYEEVVPWMTEITGYEQREELPPAAPLYGWECGYCDYRHRCGESDKPFSDEMARGFLPLTIYPKNRVKGHLAAHEELILSPTLAHEYPELADKVGAYPWSCKTCKSEFYWETIEPETIGDAPFCPTCLANDKMVHVSGPEPEHQ